MDFFLGVLMSPSFGPEMKAGRVPGMEQTTDSLERERRMRTEILGFAGPLHASSGGYLVRQ